MPDESKGCGIRRMSMSDLGLRITSKVTAWLFEAPDNHVSTPYRQCLSDIGFV